MDVNRDKPDRWKSDIALSVDMYNQWFMQFAPDAFRITRVQTTQDVVATLQVTDNLTKLSPGLLADRPDVLSTLRMSTCPPLAVDRLIGLSSSNPGLVKAMEKGKIPPSISNEHLEKEFVKIIAVIMRLIDPDIFVWLSRDVTRKPSESEVHRAATIVADRLCGAVANPIIRNAQEKRQLGAIAAWLNARGYQYIPSGHSITLASMVPGTYSFRLNVPVHHANDTREINLPIDTVVKPLKSEPGELPILIEAKSAGDFTNVNKRRKEEGMKINLLKASYGSGIRFILFLCGYFDSGYLGYEAAEGIDWVWEHRIDDLSDFGL